MQWPGKRVGAPEYLRSEPQEVANEPRKGHFGQQLRLRIAFSAHFAEFVASSADRRPFASFTASSFAQKCIKKRRGSSWSMLLLTAVNLVSFYRNALITPLTSPTTKTK